MLGGPQREKIQEREKTAAQQQLGENDEEWERSSHAGTEISAEGGQEVL